MTLNALKAADMTEDERERDQMWNRIDDQAKRTQQLEQRTVAVEGKADEHGRQLSDLSKATHDLHQSMHELIGGMKSLRWIGIGLGLLIAIIQIADAVGAIGEVVP